MGHESAKFLGTIQKYVSIFCCNSILATKLSYHPGTVFKGNTVTLKCEGGESQPKNVTYTWLKDSQQIANVITSEWTIKTASLVTRGNYTCITQNPDGSTSQSSAFLNITAPPHFIKTLPPYYDVLYSSQTVSLTCRVECYPLCSITWYKNGSRINPDNPLYYVKNLFLPADFHTNDFESVESTLVWNFTNWPNQVLDKYGSSEEYTCESQLNRHILRSVAFFEVEFPPENLTVSTDSIVNVMENERIGTVICRGEGRPTLKYKWTDKSSGSIYESWESRFSTRYSMLPIRKLSRFNQHNYICEGSNKHGKKYVEVHFNVLYTPSCSIEFGKLNGEKALVCKADANPEEVTFDWKLNSSKDDLNNNSIVDNRNRSYLILSSNRSDLTTSYNYKCFVSNSVGGGTPCEIFVPGEPFQIEVSKVTSEVVTGIAVWLKCKALTTFKVEISWYNGSILLINNDKVMSTSYSHQSEDGTFTTIGFLTFFTTRWDNQRSFKCFATNVFMKSNNIPMGNYLLHLEVLYPPVVTISSTQTTFVANENQSVLFSCRYNSNPPALLDISWYKDSQPVAETEGKYKIDTLHYLSLTITNITKEDMGEYNCRLRNKVGEGTSPNVFLDVLYGPSVKVEAKTSLQETPAKVGNITLTCKFTAGNPQLLLGTRWFVNDSTFEEYIVLNHSKESKKGFKKFLQDSSTLTLIGVDQNFIENFTCQGLNRAGIGSKSNPERVQIFYSNIPTRLVQIPSEVLHGQKFDLHCLVDNVDPSDNVTYFWFQDGNYIKHIVTPKWTIKYPFYGVRGNFSCIVTNGRRTSKPEYISVKIVAPPTFLVKPDFYMRVRSNESVKLSCTIECEPLCSILWTVDGNVLESNSSVYTIISREFSVDYGSQAKSILTFSASHLKEGSFYPFSCTSVSPKSYGPDVTATVLLRVK